MKDISERSAVIALAIVVAVVGVIELYGFVALREMRAELAEIRTDTDRFGMAAGRASKDAQQAGTAATEARDLAAQAKATADLAKGIADGAVLAARAAGATATTLAQQAAPPAAAPGSLSRADPSEGKRLALKLCTGCHVVSADQEFPPISQQPAPAFLAIANLPSSSADSLRQFLATTHTTIANPATMPNPRLTDEQMAHVITYILGLRGQH